jgi:hypothetical protein
MTVRQDHCPECGGALHESRFDTSFRLDDGSERLFFSLPGGLCLRCNQLFADPEDIERLGLRSGRCVFAIESDDVVMARAGLRAAQ